MHRHVAIGATVVVSSACASRPVERLNPDQFVVVPLHSLDPTGVTPGIRLVAPTRAGTPRQVDAAIQVSAPGYAMVVAVDLDGYLEVLYPESPDDASMVAPSEVTVLPHSFAGFGASVPSANYVPVTRPYTDNGFDRSFGLWSRHQSRSLAATPLTAFTGRGIVFAFASDGPLQLSQFSTRDGDWNFDAIESVLRGATVSSGALLFGSALAPEGHRVSVSYGSLTTLRTSGVALVDGSFAREAARNAPLGELADRKPAP